MLRISKRLGALLAILLSILTGVARWMDLTRFTDSTTGYSVYGYYWVRYAVVGYMSVIILLTGLMAAKRPVAFSQKNVPMSILCMAEALCMGGFCGVGVVRYFTVGMNPLVLTCHLLFFVSAVWMFLLGSSRLAQNPHPPTESALFGVLGTLSFCMLAITRYALEPSGIQRVDITANLLAAFAAMLFGESLVRAVYLPEYRCGFQIYASGMLCFMLSGCVQLPQLIYTTMQNGPDLYTLLEGTTLILFGLVGMGYAWGASGPVLVLKDRTNG